MQQGAPVGIEMNQANTEQTWWTVLKGTKPKTAAMKLIQYITRAKPQAEWVDLYLMAVANKNAYNFIEPEILPYLSISP